MKHYKTTLAGVAVTAVLGFVGFAFAHGGSGYGGYHMGYGNHMGMEYGPHMGYGGSNRYAGLTDEQTAEVEKSRESFLSATNELRNSIYQKRLELRSELSKQDPDTDRLKAIQKELSELEGTFDQKRLDYELEISKVEPDARRGYGRGYGGRMMGRGPGYGGNCWD